MTTVDSITVNVLDRGVYSVPISSSIFQISGNITTYQHSITARGGCESCSLTLDVRLEEASQYLDMILRHIRTIDQYSQQVWTGIITSITVDYGGATTSVGIDNFASRYALFRSSSTSPAATLFDANIAQTYCDKYMPIQLKATIANGAMQTAYLTTQLNMFGMPNVQTVANAETRSSQQCRVTINAVGYYSTLAWVVVPALKSGLGTTSDAFTISMLTEALTNNNYYGIGYFYGSTNTTIGVTAEWNAYTTYQQIIDDALNAGTDIGQVLSWGVFPTNNSFELRLSQINYKTIDYVKSLGSAKIFGTAGNEIPPTQVLPDKNLSVQELKPLYQQYGLSSIPGLQYIDRVNLQIDRNGYQLALEPSGLWDNIYELARLVKDRKWRFSTR
jgi:hypothetical protein